MPNIEDLLRQNSSVRFAAIIGLNLGMVYVTVLLNTANGAVFNALQEKNSGAFYGAFGTIMELILLYLAVALLLSRVRRSHLDKTGHHQTGHHRLAGHK